MNAARDWSRRRLPELVDRMMPGSDAPAGSAFAMNARSLVSFARVQLETTTYDPMHVEQVKTPDGTVSKLQRAVFSHLLAELAGVRLAELPASTARPR